MPDELPPDGWYWDRRNRKAISPKRVEERTVTFETVWHREEVADALEHGALVPLDDVGLDRTETTFDLLDSFRCHTESQNSESNRDEHEGT